MQVWKTGGVMWACVIRVKSDGLTKNVYVLHSVTLLDIVLFWEHQCESQCM